MKSTQRRQQGRDSFDLIEEAVHLLRTAPVTAMAAYYIGSLPFALGLLYFWADMSHSPFAPQHLAEGSFGMTGLFLWMKFWQVIFARRLRAHLAGGPAPAWTFRRCARVFFIQAILQPAGLFLIPLALIFVIPFAWTFTFFQNLTALPDGDSAHVRKLTGRAWRQARLWPRQNYFVLAIMLAFGFYVFLNWLLVCLTLPQLAKMLLGVTSVFTESPFAALNTTFLTGMLALTWLCVDPILKAIYVLRCFYGESLQSGEDLKAELKSFASFPQKAAIGLSLLLLLAGAHQAVADDKTAAAPPIHTQIASSDLNQAISQTLHESKFAWRMPRETVADDNTSDNMLTRFFDKIGTMLRHWARATLDWLGKLLKKLFPARHEVYSSNGSTGYGWIMSLQILLYGLVAAAIAALVILVMRSWRGKRPSATMAAEAIQPIPDLSDENVRADQLPEDGWTRLARELLERGEFRLAMRAFYLASLSHLAARNLISIARFKSNREYERELRRRGHSFPEMLRIFGDNLGIFESIWYGTHAADRESASQFAANVERIRAAG